MRHAEKFLHILVGAQDENRLIFRKAVGGTGQRLQHLIAAGDSPAVGVVLDPDCGFYHETEAPIILDDTTNKFEKGRPKIRVYTSVDSRFILEDFIAKLEVLYGKGSDTK